jgi:hypothetical protein
MRLKQSFAAVCALGGLALVASPLVDAAGAFTSTPAGTYAVYCSATTATAFTGCYVDGTSNLSVPAGSQIATDPVVPPTATPTTGLTSPDGILAVIPAADIPSGLGIPSGAVTFLYIDKQVNYFIPGTLVSPTAGLTVPTTSATNVVVTGNYTTNFGTGAGTYYVAGNGDASAGPRSLTCTGSSYNSVLNQTTLQSCTSTGGSSETIAVGNDVGAPGSCISSGTALQTIGEGSLKGKTLFKNNEDWASVRIAYTTNGTTFTDVTPAGGITGLGSPTNQAFAWPPNETSIRWVSPGGSMVVNPDGSLGLFFSEGQCSDGDSDAFGAIMYSTSTNGGLTWTTPSLIPDTDTAFGTQFLTTDYTFGASIANDSTAPPSTLDVSAYYEGRIYSPSAVGNPSSGNLTMTFAGYRTSKPLPATGSGVVPIGRSSESSLSPASTQYSPLATDPALYRNVLTVTLTPVQNQSSGAWSYSAATPVVDDVENGPWVTGQGDPGSGGTELPYSPNGSGGTYQTGGGPTNPFTVTGGTGTTQFPNLATYTGSGSTGAAIPYTTGYSGTPGPLAGYCGTGGAGNTGPVAVEPKSDALPMSPYYFPHTEANPTPGVGGYIGFFDYRPKDSDEAVVIATSPDAKTWTVQAEGLELSQNHCPNGNTDAVLQTTTDDGQGHAFDLTVNGIWWLYTLNRSNGTLDTLGSEFLARQLSAGSPNYGLLASEPVGTGSSTTSVGTQTITDAPGGVSTSTFNAVDTTPFQEIPGRIYVTPPVGAILPESPLNVALPITGAGMLGLAFLVVRRRGRRTAQA